MVSPNYTGEADSLAAKGQSDLFLCKKITHICHAYLEIYCIIVGIH